MSSILTNNSAMVALQTLNNINKNLATTQNEISTGKSVASAKDNSAIWSISQVMQSDVDGFAAISDSLALGQSTVAVGRNAAEQVTELLGQVKEKVVAAQEDNVDRDKLQSDLVSLREQISSIVSSAQFNGQNLLSNTSTTSGEGSISILGSLDRDSNGNVSASDISVNKQDLGQGDATAGTAADAVASTTAITAGSTGTAMTFTAAAVGAGQTFTFDLAGGLDAGTDVGTTGTVTYVAREGDTVTDVVNQMVGRLNFQVTNQGYGDLLTFQAGSSAGVIELVNDSANSITLVAGDAEQNTAGTAADGTIGGGLELLGDLDVSTAAGAEAALGAIEVLIQSSIDAAAEFGTGEKRLEIQNDFIGKLMDSMKSGIGALVDADMEEASARLQALQVQQQLGIQSLSIANQAPQNILSLFR